jgi:(hydroxyamino)benzene mutase
MASIEPILCKAGFALFVAGLLLGAAIPRFKSPRLGLSAHLTAVQGGIALIAIGLLWPHFNLAPLTSTVLSFALWISTWLLSLGIALAAMCGASKVLPIAGQGLRASAKQEQAVAILVGGSSVVLTLSSIVIFALWIGGT